MFRKPRFRLSLLAVCGWCFLIVAYAAPAAGQAADLPERPEQHQHHMHGNHMDMDMNMPSGVSARCEPSFTYEEGPRGPNHWNGVCSTGHMQAPVNITNSVQIPIPPLPPLEFKYQPAELDLVNDCNEYEIKARFPQNQWLKVNRKPYRLSEIDFHEPGENAVNGVRPPMSVLLVHLSPEATILVIEVPVVVGKENPVIKTLWQHIPVGGKERIVKRVKINAADLLPVDHGFYRFPGSLTTPICNEGVQWYLMKRPIEMSKAQIARYKEYYHDTARPLQPLNNRPVVASK
jgi:carbonic anhydrase